MAKIDLKEILRDVLIANEISEEKFSLNGYKENAICIEKFSEGYIVYDVDIDGEKFNTVRCARLLKACYALISQIGRSVSQIIEMKSAFTDNVIYKALEELGVED